MEDHFATLELERRPALAPDAIREAFHRLAGAAHPDRAGGTDDAFTALNRAQAVLQSPASRLAHLLELESAAAPAQTAPPAQLGDLFMSIGALDQAITALLKRRAAATTPLAQALLLGDEKRLSAALAAASASLEKLLAAAHAELLALDAAWAARDSSTLARAAALQSRFAFLEKWSAQLRELAFALNPELPTPNSDLRT